MTSDKKIKGLQNRKSGYWAEFLARCYFKIHGWKILYTNYKIGKGTLAGEVDFIASRNKILAFVEVKKRGSLELAAYAIKPKQRQRLINAAKYFLAAHTMYNSYDIRFDAVLVTLPFKIKHIPDAWGE